MYDNLFSINNKHTQIETSTSAGRCLKCFDAIIVLPEDKKPLTALSDSVNGTEPPMLPYGRCKCHNVGVMLDSQSTLRVYTNCLSTVHIGNAILNKSNQVVSMHWANYSETFIYTPYGTVKNTLPTFEDYSKVTKKVRTKKLKVNDLVESLDLSEAAKGRTFFYKTKD